MVAAVAFSVLFRSAAGWEEQAHHHHNTHITTCSLSHAHLILHSDSKGSGWFSGRWFNRERETRTKFLRVIYWRLVDRCRSIFYLLLSASASAQTICASGEVKTCQSRFLPRSHRAGWTVRATLCLSGEMFHVIISGQRDFSCSFGRDRLGHAIFGCEGSPHFPQMYPVTGCSAVNLFKWIFFFYRCLSPISCLHMFQTE